MLRIMPKTARGPLAGQVLARLSTWLATERYTRAMVPQIEAVARGLSAWMDEQDICLDDLNHDTLDAFNNAYPRGVAGHTLVSQRICVVRRFLTETRHLPSLDVRKRTRRPDAQTPPPLPAAVTRELDHWAAWQRDLGGISPGCIRGRRDWVTPLLGSLYQEPAGVDWAACTITVINSFIADRSAGYSDASRDSIIDATRSLIRWALATGRLKQDLTGGILRARTTRATLPRGLANSDVTALQGACNTETRSGIRDLAVITVLWRLALRAGETAGLTLDDINWHTGQLSVIGKRDRRLTLPIPDDVGQALVAWLTVRPTTATDRAVFVRLRPPIHALTSAGISDIVHHRADDAGLGIIHAHRLRHTAAMNVIAAGGSLVEAQELLGHHHITSTQTYARSDLASLRTLTVPFGKVPQ